MSDAAVTGDSLDNSEALRACGGQAVEAEGAPAPASDVRCVTAAERTFRGAGTVISCQLQAHNHGCARRVLPTYEMCWVFSELHVCSMWHARRTMCWLLGLY